MGTSSGDEALQRGVQQAIQLVKFALGVELGEKGKEATPTPCPTTPSGTRMSVLA